jgi:dihydroxyacetone kinase-like predicted kinase
MPRLEEMGDSVLVVGDEATIKVHVHTDDPDAAVALFHDAGGVSQLDVADMREQVAERRARLSGGRCGAVAVVAGEGLTELFEDLGAYVVDGGETFNPSIYDLLAAIHAVPAAEVVVFPNNPNVVMAAERAAELSDKTARVVPCTSQQAGLAALVELDAEAGVSDNFDRLSAAVSAISVGSIAPAARDDARGRFVTGDAVGFVGDEIVAWGSPDKTLADTMARLGDGAEILTVLDGADAPIPLEDVAERAPAGVEVELQHGGQPHYWWLLAAE